MLIRLILDHIPRTWQAAVALFMSIVSTTWALNGLTLIMMKPHFMDWVACIVGTIVGTVATIIFYREQNRSKLAPTTDQMQVELLSQAGRELRVKQAADTIKAWNLNEISADKQPETPVDPKNVRKPL
jgi:hypothetical protein